MNDEQEDDELAASRREWWQRDCRVVPALRGPGTALLGPERPGAGAGVTMVAPPGVLLRTAPPSAFDYSDEGWRIASWRPDARGRLRRLDQGPPAEHRTVTLAIVRAWIGMQVDPQRWEAWAQAELERCVAVWLRILRPQSNATPVLRKASLRRLDEALMDAAKAWGEGWIEQRSSLEVRSAITVARARINAGGDDDHPVLDGPVAVASRPGRRTG